MTRQETSEFKSQRHDRYAGLEQLKTWSTAEPNLPPEIVDWERLCRQVAPEKNQIERDRLTGAVASRHNVPKTFARDTVSEAVHVGLLETDDDERVGVIRR